MTNLHTAIAVDSDEHNTDAVSSQRSAGGWASRVKSWWNALVGAIGIAVGLAPHVLHHVGLLAGTALIAGAGGTALFGAVGLVASVPLLLRLHRRFHSWWAPAIGLSVFVIMFLVSAFIIGPAISGVGGSTGSDQPAPAIDHNSHHGE